jgi:pimeloyl-ACP methyl ester carboxylesterase
MPEDARFVIVDGIRMRVRTSPDLGKDYSKPIVLLFHGYSFSLDVWADTGTLDALSQQGLPYIAVDLPRGKATKSQKIEKKSLSDYVPLLNDLIKELGVNFDSSKFVIIGPSMGGAFALTFALENKDKVLGLVLVAPSLSGVKEESLKDLEIPVLLIWGDKDNVFPVEQHGPKLKQILPRSKLLIIKGARHPAYLDRPQEFHELLFDFIEEIS